VQRFLTCPNCGIGFDAALEDACPACGAELDKDFVSRVREDVTRAEAHQTWTPTIPITTGTEVPGSEVEEVIGPVFAMTVRSRNIVSQTGARLKSVVGGELRAMTKALEQGRYETLLQLEERARDLGADAVIAMRFDAGDLGGVWIQLFAYGTAVRLAPRSGPGRS
jgi:uncharacterized protein YbjQ (UPF0145 family)